MLVLIVKILFKILKTKDNKYLKSDESQ